MKRAAATLAAFALGAALGTVNPWRPGDAPAPTPAPTVQVVERHPFCQGRFVGWELDRRAMQLRVHLQIEEHGRWHQTCCVFWRQAAALPEPTPDVGQGVVLFRDRDGGWAGWVPDAEAGTADSRAKWAREIVNETRKDVP